MYKANFEYLTSEENLAVSSQWRIINKSLQRGLITEREAFFLFTERMIKAYQEKAFGICTNCKEFKKEKE